MDSCCGGIQEFIAILISKKHISISMNVCTYVLVYIESGMCLFVFVTILQLSNKLVNQL